MRFSLQDMVRQTLAEAERRETVKLAAVEGDADDQKKKEEKKQGPPTAKTPPDNTSTSPERNEESYEEKTSSAFVEKLASAAEFLNENFLKVAVGEPEPAPSHDPPGAPGVGPGEGAGTLEINKAPTSGTQSTETGQASSAGKVPEKNPPSDVASPGQTNPATALQTDINDPPGGSEDWTNKDVQKQAGVGEFLAGQGRALKGMAQAGKRVVVGDQGLASGGRKAALKVLGKKSREAAPALAAAGGVAGGVGAGMALSKGKDKKASVDRVRAIMDKMAEDANNPAKVGAKATNPHQSSPEGVSAAGEGKPSVPGEVSKQESLVGGNQAAINYTKQQAKAVPKARMGEVLAEPAQKKSTDPVLHQNLDAASGAGVKLSSVTKAAAARALLHKIAEEGASEDASPEQKERAAKLQATLQAKKEEQSKESTGMPVGGGY